MLQQSKSPDRARSWFQPVAGTEVEFLAAEFVDFRYPKHLHEGLAVGIIERGAQRFVTPVGAYVMPQQELCVVDAGLVHWGWAGDDSGWRYRMIYPSSETVAAALERQPSEVERLGFGVHTIADPRLFGSFARLHRRAQLGDDVDADTLAFLRVLFTRHASVRPIVDAPSRRIASQIAEYLHDHPSEAVTSERLAAVVGVSVGHAIRSFSSTFGLAPAAFHLALRIDRARRLLAGGMPAADVSAQLGFFDQSHFHRHFVKHVGRTPGSYVDVD